MDTAKECKKFTLKKKIFKDYWQFMFKRQIKVVVFLFVYIVVNTIFFKMADPTVVLFWVFFYLCFYKACIEVCYVLSVFSDKHNFLAVCKGNGKLEIKKFKFPQ